MVAATPKFGAHLNMTAHSSAMRDLRITLRVWADNNTMLLVGVFMKLYRLQRVVGFKKHDA